jgi:hypothetical protein
MPNVKNEPAHYGGMTFAEMLATLKRPLKRWMSEDDARAMGGWDPVDGWPRSAGDFAKPTKETDHDD